MKIIYFRDIVHGDHVLVEKDVEEVVKEVYGEDTGIEIYSSTEKHGKLARSMEDDDIVIGHRHGARYAGIWKKHYDSNCTYISIEGNCNIPSDHRLHESMRETTGEVYLCDYTKDLLRNILNKLKAE